MEEKRFSQKEKEKKPNIEKANKNCHEGHRGRMRNLFEERGLDGMPDHMALELLLYYALPRRDVNGISHRLIQHFGSLSNVFDADFEELKEVNGIGENAAVLIKLIPALCGRYSMQKVQKKTDFSSVERAADFFMDYYLTKTNEEVTGLFLDSSGALISFEKIHEGSVNSSEVNPRKIAELALKKNATSIILAHNHPGGSIVPSDRDISTTKRLMEVFSPIDLTVKAHLVVSGNRYTDIVSEIYDHAQYQVRYIAVQQENVPKRTEKEE